MSQLVKKILRALGFDRAVTFGLLARVWSLFSGPITMVVIATKLSPSEQGFYFTFSSLLALQVFFDLGLMFVIAQFTSHEFVDLTWGRNGTVSGAPMAYKRFTDLLCKTTLWFGVASLLMMVVLIPAGIFFFGQKAAVEFPWRLPWALAVAGTALNLFVMPFYAIILGSGDVVTVNKREMLAAVLSSVLCWTVICLGGKLYAAFAVNLGALAISWGYLLGTRRELVKQAFREVRREILCLRNEPGGLSWWREIWPMQWRLAVSAGSSYFIFQLFNPVLFHYHGSVVAGQMGMTLTAANALLAASSTVFNAKVPELGKLVARKDWKRLDFVFFDSTKRGLMLALVGATAGSGAIWALQSYTDIGKRFIPVQYAVILFATVFFQLVNTSLSSYLRSHKKEPLMTVAVIASLLQSLSTWLLGKYFGVPGVTCGFFAVTALFVFPCTLAVWKRCRTEWHA